MGIAETWSGTVYDNVLWFRVQGAKRMLYNLMYR